VIRLVLVGASGRMGACIAALLPEQALFHLTGGIGRRGGSVQGLPLSPALPPLLEDADLVMDFSNAALAAATVAACAAARVPLLLGTTGLARELEAPLMSAAEHIPLLVAPNTSTGIAVLAHLVREATSSLGEEFDIEIIESHHRHKLDAPSGTALALGRAAARARGGDLETLAATARAGARLRGQIGLASVRGGDVVGEHEVRFLGAGESLSLKHVAAERTVFARGALRAGAWLVAQAPGRYSMADSLGLNKQ
jgi:4-hydroxy-tetrahydrodipicolinate reductase